MLTLRHLFLLLYLWAGCGAETFDPNSNGTCTKETCVEACDGPCRFLQCVGLPASADNGKHHMQRLKAVMESTLDLYTFMRSTMTRVPFLELQGVLKVRPLEAEEAYHDEDLVHMWLSVRIRPLLHSISKHFLTCLSTKKFSCTTYQAVVEEFSHHFSDMNPARQKWIYTFFMYPFLSGEGVAGCVRPEEGSEEWLMKNFGHFKAMARMKDFSQLNMQFQGLEVLHLLSPEQKAELLLRPEVAGLDNGTLSLVFNSLMEGGHGGPPGPGRPPDSWTMPPWIPGHPPGPNMTWTGPSHNWTMPGPPPTWIPGHPPGPNMTWTGPSHNWTMPGPPPTWIPGHPPGPNMTWTGPSHNWTMPGPPPTWIPGHPPGPNMTWTGPSHNWTMPGPPPTWIPGYPPGPNMTWTGPSHNWTMPGPPPTWIPGYPPGPNMTWTGPSHNWTMPGPPPTWIPGHPPGPNMTWNEPGHDWTMPGYPEPDVYGLTYLPEPPPPTLSQFVHSIMGAVRPACHLVSDFVSLINTRDVSEIRSTTLVQMVLNRTLAELAEAYGPQVEYLPPVGLTEVELWFSQEVLPVLQELLGPGEALMSDEVVQAFHQLFYLDSGMDNETTELQETCSISLEASCGLTNTVEEVARVLHCVSQSHLTLTEENIMTLLMEMSRRLSSLVQQISTTDFDEVVDYFRELFHQVDSPAPERLDDPDFIRLWFRVKLLPLLPDVPEDLYHCLSRKNFTCPAYQALVAELSEHVPPLDPQEIHGPMVYKYLILPFLHHRNSTDPRCLSSANSSAEWLEQNFGYFSIFANLPQLYYLDPNFAALEALEVLSPQQTAQLMLLPLPSAEGKDELINGVFDFLLEAPEERSFKDVVRHTAVLATGSDESNTGVFIPCSSFRLIIERLYDALESLSPEFEPFIYEHIDRLIQLAPQDCLPQNVTCPITQFNGTHICIGVNSTELQNHLRMSVGSMEVPCHFPLEDYACAKLENFTAGQLVSLLTCELPGNHSRSRKVWKMLLSQQASVLELAMDGLANMTDVTIGPSARVVLDVIGELKVGLLSDEELRDADLMRVWFSGRLKGFLPSASGGFLRCLISRNLSCQSYQQILEAFSGQFENMSPEQRHTVLSELILPFLSRQEPDGGCVSGLNSTEWLRRNLGRFSVLLSLRDVLRLNPTFAPLEALRLLSPRQTAELLLRPGLSSAPPQELIQAVFDHLSAAPLDRRFQEVLEHLIDISEEGNVSCSTYRTIFMELDRTLTTAPPPVAAAIDHSKLVLLNDVPRGCNIYSGHCPDVFVNETSICAEVNSTLLQMLLDQGRVNQSLCDFSVEEYACASLPALTAEDLAAVLLCNTSRSSQAPLAVWELFLSQTTVVLEPALELLANQTFHPMSPAASRILDAITNVLLRNFNPAMYQSKAFVRLWFGQRLRPFLPAISDGTLSCLSTQNLSCSSYQALVQIFSQHRPSMALQTQISVSVSFIKPFLSRTNTSDPNCSTNTTSAQWLLDNVGAFSGLISVSDLQILNPDFFPLEALPHLTVRQLAELSSTPGQLSTPGQVAMAMAHVPSPQLAEFFDYVSPAIMGQEDRFPPAVRSAMLQQVFDRANLSEPEVSDEEVLIWLRNRLPPLLLDLSPLHVAPFFGLVAGRNCSTEQEGVTALNSVHATLNASLQDDIHDHIVTLLREPTPLRCYGDGNNQSFYAFLNGRFLDFPYPNLTGFLSLMPDSRRTQLVNTLPPSHLGDLLRRPGTVDDQDVLCLVYSLYTNTPLFLETESVPEVVRRQTLPCVWPTALSSAERSEVNAWFDRRLPSYLVFLTEDLLASNATQNASCLAFQRLVSALAMHNYSAADFNTEDVYDVIRSYLASGAAPRCYDAGDPELNSTAWFAEYIGAFVPFLTLSDLNTFGSTQVLQVFSVNPENIALLNQSDLPVNLTSFYTELIYQEDSSFNPLLLPLVYRCFATASAFSQLNAAQSTIVLHNLTTLCTDLDPQISAALAANYGNNLTSDAIAALSSESVIGLSVAQINSANPQDLLSSVGTLGAASGWNQGQTLAIVQALTSSGGLQITNSSTLIMLGSLLAGVPSSTIGSIAGPQLISAAQNPSFVAHLSAAPTVLQQTVVSQIISVDSSSTAVIENVPDDLATEIPRVFLTFSSITVVQRLNRKRWRKQQAELFFDTVADGLEGQENNISSSLLAGFTCTRVVTLSKVRISRLVRACRRSGSRRVILQETQLTCMYNHIKNNEDVNSFALYPPDVLLYYDYSTVPVSTCRSYFQELADADFTVFSKTLAFKRAELFTNARSCLNITGSGLSRDNVMVLGNMVCTLDGPIISSSHPSILEKLKNCQDFTDSQVTAMESLLLSGNSTYGAPDTWTRQTLEDLGILPLYLTKTFYQEFDTRTKRRFLRTFRRTLRRNRVSRRKIGRMVREIRSSIRSRGRRAVECTVGEITQVTISDPAFLLDYSSVGQFNSCLSTATARDNLAALAQAVDETDYLRIVLGRLQEAYAATSSIPEDQVQVLGPVSRVATSQDISMWIITRLDTLSALLSSDDGEWDPALAAAVISKYLAHPGNTLGSAELNAVGGANLCALDVNVLGNITADSIREANALTVSSCSIEKKRVLFSIALEAFSNQNRAANISQTNFQLITPYLGGANSTYVTRLADSSVNMDLETFTSLDPEVVNTLNARQVGGLLGSNTDDLVAYKNNSVVSNWAGLQPQSELDRLVPGLQGRSEASTTPATMSPTTGGTTAGGTTTGGATAGGTTTGGATAGGTTTGGTTAGGTTTGGATAGGTTTGGATAGGTTTGGATAGGTTTGGTTAGGTTTGGATAGGTTTGGTTAGGATAGGTTTGGATAGGTTTGGATAGGTTTGGTAAGGTTTGGTPAGGTTTGGSAGGTTAGGSAAGGGTTTSTTTGAGGEGRRPDVICLLVVLLVFLTSQHILLT